MSLIPNPVRSLLRSPGSGIDGFFCRLVFGFFSFTSLPITLMPELTYPTITVRTEYPGAAPEEVDK